MSPRLAVLGTIVQLELRQRIRSVSWLVLVSVVFVLVGIVTVLLWFALPAFGSDDLASAGIYSTLIFFVLLIGSLVTPATSGAAINGDRDAGTLATTQVTLVTTTQLVLGKFLAAWTVALTFLAASVPAMLFTVIVGEVRPDTLIASLGVLVLLLGVVAAVGVGASALITRPLFSVVTTYLVVAALSVGTLIAFGLGSLAAQTTVSYTYTPLNYDESVFDEEEGRWTTVVCGVPERQSFEVPRTDTVWGFLAANPYVVLADASPPVWDEWGNPRDLFGGIAFAVRAAQQPPEPPLDYDECADARGEGGQQWQQGPTPREIYDASVPSWFVGLAIHLALGGGMLAAAIARTRTPAASLPRGSRVA
jgi:ABC-type transport system involved in multi-copper enzyme maturation permease subunit